MPSHVKQVAFCALLLITTLRLVVVASLELQSLIIAGLAAVVPSSLWLLLVPAETCSQLDVNAWWCGESESLGHLDQVQFVHVEHGTQGMRGVRLNVGAISFFGGLCNCQYTIYFQ